MRILVFLVCFTLFSESIYSQNNENFKIEEADSSLISFTVKSFKGNRLVTEKSYFEDFLTQEVYISNDTVFLLQYYSETKQIEFKTLFHIPKDTLMKFVGFDNDSYWDQYRFQDEDYDKKGRLQKVYRYKKGYDPYTSEYKYIPEYLEVFKKGKRSKCFTWEYTGHDSNSMEAVPTKCR